MLILVIIWISDNPTEQVQNKTGTRPLQSIRRPDDASY